METEILISLGTALGLLVSWALQNVPVVKGWFNDLESGWKRIVVVAMCVVAGIAAYAGGADLADSILALLAALVGTQTGYSLLPKE